MVTTSVKKLKLTAVNIRSVLTENTKVLGKLQVKKSSLRRRQRLKAQRAAEEKKIEGEGKKKGPLKSVLSNVTTSVMSMKDKILNFFGYFLMGMIVNNLPMIIENLKGAYEFVEPLVKITWKVISVIAKALFSFGSWIVGLFNKKDAEKNVSALADTSSILEKEIDSLKIPGEEDNSQTKSTKNIPISKSTTNTEVSKLKSSENVEEKREVSTDEKNTDIDDELESDALLSTFDSIMSMDPAKLVGKNGGSESAGVLPSQIASISPNTESFSKNVISKVDKYAHDLKGNIDDQTNTVIIPIEVEKMTSTNTSNRGSSGLNSVEPIPSTGSDMRMP